MTKTPKVLVGITAGLALLVGPTAVYAGQKSKAKNVEEEGRGDLKIKQKSVRKSSKVGDTTVKGNTSCGGDTEASGLVALAIPVNACDVLDVTLDNVLNDSLNNLLKNLLKNGLL